MACSPPDCPSKLYYIPPAKEGALEFLANPVLSAPIALLTIGLLTLIGLAAGYFPTRRTARVDLVEVQRHE